MSIKKCLDSRHTYNIHIIYVYTCTTNILIVIIYYITDLIRWYFLNYSKILFRTFVYKYLIRSNCKFEVFLMVLLAVLWKLGL